jgi:hypothetical protein
VLPSICREKKQTDGTVVDEYYGSVSNFLEIDIFSFYGGHAGMMPELDPIIRQILGHSSSSESPETVFSYGRYTVSDYRTSLKPARLEKLMLSGTNYRVQRRPAKNLPKLPRLGVPFTKQDMEDADDADVPAVVGVDADIPYNDSDVSDGEDGDEDN